VSSPLSNLISPHSLSSDQTLPLSTDSHHLPPSSLLHSYPFSPPNLLLLLRYGAKSKADDTMIVPLASARVRCGRTQRYRGACSWCRQGWAVEWVSDTYHGWIWLGGAWWRLDPTLSLFTRGGRDLLRVSRHRGWRQSSWIRGPWTRADDIKDSAQQWWQVLTIVRYHFWPWIMSKIN
jgi:hypothetical protein